MDPNQNKLFTARWRLLLTCIGLLVLESASACGRARTEDTGSETHWLVRCDSDLECSEGSCECGVCSKTCDTSADCGALGLANLECVPRASCDSGASDSSSGAGGVCLLPCEVDADCSELGASATCRSQRCELPDGALGEGATMPPAAADGSMQALCDGSTDVRVAFATYRNFLDVTSVYHYFAQSYGDTFFVIDGQCRFWQGRLADGQVYSGTMDATAAQRFAREIGFGRVSELDSSADEVVCEDGARSALWTREGRSRCACGCGENPDTSTPWRRAFRAAVYPRAELFMSGELLNGPAQLGLVSVPISSAPEKQLWGLDRAPRANEFIEVYSSTGSIVLNESSGARITDEVELRQLRFSRTGYQAYLEGAEHTPMVWSNPETGDTEEFDMLLRDEVPAHVQDALDALRAP